MRLNAVALVFVGLASAAFPIHAEQKFASQPQAGVPNIGTRTAIKLPDYVPVINYDQFLLASRGEDFGSDDGLSFATRSAAEALSAKFAVPSDGSKAANAEDPVNPNVLDASSDPKRIIKVAELLESDDLIDPAKVASAAMTAETQNAEPSQSVVRVTRRAPRRAAVSHSRVVKRGISRQQRNRVASAATSQRSGSAYNGIGADLERLVGFGTLTPDHRLTN
ncbi:hypothetical protein HYPDE_36368 [Hyphomicrobium denitrificans 1NES1]|uniref:Uncharacterized protein n=1 Tax=Hyphomicrobium denitrificans 1NES1 TaxID=670307 RepID=N0BFR7_9HYPH|nr:hypothetical protein [Hyphomicrobium denitrificans]AGK58945.1 hypothetical protein HYPDE_36368 [Hyphomicrobium denitrificans 1NES1]